MRPSHLFRACMPVSFLISILSMAAWAQPPAKADSSPDLERVLDRIDQTAVTFRTTEANFVWDQYQKVVDDKDTQEGKVYFSPRRQRDANGGGDHQGQWEAPGKICALH